MGAAVYSGSEVKAPSTLTGEPRGLLRFSTAGSVDDGKSTLIGRLLYDSKGAYEDQIASVRKNGKVDLALLTDGLRAEREQGITIDVAYRYFATPRRKFIIADTPGHEQYTRNMATGASTADLAIVLVDARKGVLPQSRRHAFIASLLGIPKAVVAVNKMDLVEFREDVFREIRAEFEAFARELSFRELRFIPLSALEGDNVVKRSVRTPWYQGESLLEYLENVDVAVESGEFRFPVQLVLRPNLDFRGYAGQVASGTIRKGDPVTVVPSGRTSRIRALVSWDGELEEAQKGDSVTLTLEDEIDVSRGDLLVKELPQIANRFEANLVWMNEEALVLGRNYLLKHASRQVRARVSSVRHRVDINTLDRCAASTLNLNEIGVAAIEAQLPLCFDPYTVNRSTGSFILIDPISNATVAAGMILRATEASASRGPVMESERRTRNGHEPFTIHYGGTLEEAQTLERELFDRGCLVRIAATAGEAAALEKSGFLAILLLSGAAAATDAAAICRDLEVRGILHTSERFSGGEGI